MFRENIRDNLNEEIFVLILSLLELPLHLGVHFHDIFQVAKHLGHKPSLVLHWAICLDFLHELLDRLQVFEIASFRREHLEDDLLSLQLVLGEGGLKLGFRQALPGLEMKGRNKKKGRRNRTREREARTLLIFLVFLG